MSTKPSCVSPSVLTTLSLSSRSSSYTLTSPNYDFKHSKACIVSILRQVRRSDIISFVPKKRRSGLADITRIDRILRAILDRFRNRFYCVGSSHYSYLCFTLETGGRAQYCWYLSLKRSLLSSLLSYLKNVFRGF